jgi:hypothetical protein
MSSARSSAIAAAACAVLALLVVAPVLAQGGGKAGPPSGGKAAAPTAERAGAPKAPAAPPAEAPTGAEGEGQQASGYAAFLDAHFGTVHLLGKVGAAGVVTALLIGLFIFAAKPKGARRASIRRVHMAVGATFGVLAMTHGTMIDLGHIAKGEANELLNSGSFFCTAVFLIVLSGLLRYYRKSARRYGPILHRAMVTAWLGLVFWHVLPKLLEHG